MNFTTGVYFLIDFRNPLTSYLFELVDFCVMSRESWFYVLFFFMLSKRVVGLFKSLILHKEPWVKSDKILGREATTDPERGPFDRPRSPSP